MSYEVRSVAETSTAMPNLSYYRRVNPKNFIHGGATYRRITFGKSNEGKSCMFTQQATPRHALVYWEEEGLTSIVKASQVVELFPEKGSEVNEK